MSTNLLRKIINKGCERYTWMVDRIRSHKAHRKAALRSLRDERGESEVHALRFVSEAGKRFED
jgi:hypothetical protein